MKVKSTTVLLLLLCLIFKPSHSQNKFIGLQNAGFTAELTRLKGTSEAYLIKILESKQINDSRRDACLAKYNILKMVTDQFIVQLITDVTLQNKPRIYKKLNSFFKANSIENLESVSEKDIDNDIKVYILQYKLIFTRERQFYSCTSSTDALEMPGIEAIVTTIQGIIKDISEAKASKVEKISTILDALRLASIKDLKESKD